VSIYSEQVIANVEFLGSRARELTDQEIERARSLDTKAGAIVAASVALVGASVAFIARLADLDGGAGAKTLWAIELIVALIALLFAGGLAVWALAPRVIRSTVAFHEIEAWETPRVLEADPTVNQGSLLRASVHSIGLSRKANNRKARRQKWASWILAGALISISALTISVAVHAAAYPEVSSKNVSHDTSQEHRSRQSTSSR
jgi:hypothetical protein